MLPRDLLDNVAKYIPGRPDIAKSFPNLLTSNTKKKLSTCTDTVNNNRLELVKLLPNMNIRCRSSDVSHAIKNNNYDIAKFLIDTYKIEIDAHFVIVNYKDNLDYFNFIKWIFDNNKLYNNREVLAELVYHNKYKLFDVLYNRNTNTIYNLLRLVYYKLYMNRWGPIRAIINPGNVCDVALDKLKNTNYVLSANDRQYCLLPKELSFKDILRENAIPIATSALILGNSLYKIHKLRNAALNKPKRKEAKAKANAKSKKVKVKAKASTKSKLK